LRSLQQLSVKERLGLINILFIASGLIGIMGAWQIACGAKLHKLNFLHTKYNAEFARMLNASNSQNTPALPELTQLVMSIREQPVECMKVIGPIEKLAMAAAGTSRAYELCVEDKALADRTLVLLEDFQAGKMSVPQLYQGLRAANMAFQENSNEFAPLVQTTVSSILFAMMFLVIAKGLAIAMVGMHLSRGVSRNHDALQFAQAETFRLKEELELILNNIPVRIWMKDDNNRILRLNRAAADSMGLRMQDAEGKSTYDLFPEMAHKYHEDDLEVIESGRAKLGIIEPYTPVHGEQGWTRTDKVPYLNVDGRRYVFVAATDITHEINTQEKLKRSQERYDLAITGASHGIWDWDIPNNTMHYSDRNFEMLGEQPVHQCDSAAWWLQRVHPDDVPPITHALDEHRRFGKDYDVRYRIMHNDGTWRWWRSRGKAVKDESGTPVRMLGTNSDVTEIVEAQMRAEQASVAKSQFLANMSHEIRTPMNGVLGMSQVLAKTELDDEQQHMVEIINQSGESLMKILNDVLDLAKIEAQKLDVVKAPFNPVNLAETVVALHQENAQAKGVNLKLQVMDEISSSVSGDADRIRQVLNNLVSNAIKFTHEGTVTVHLTAEDTATADQHLVFSVEDSGIGIPEDKLDAMFEPFEQADTSSTRAHGGTGLGLTISRRLLALMDGWIEASSDIGVGTVFRFGFPAPNTEQPAEETPAENSPRQQLTGTKILLAEDNKVNQLVMKALLQSTGVDITVVETGRDAITAWQDGDFDIVFMDVQMPDMDGISATAEIRRLEAENALTPMPIVALTANVMKHQIEEYLAAGIDYHVAKPVDETALLSVLETAVTKQCEDLPEKQYSAM
jgi:PAS domain S-box-containing protein